MICKDSLCENSCENSKLDKKRKRNQPKVDSAIMQNECRALGQLGGVQQHLVEPEVTVDGT